MKIAVQSGLVLLAGSALMLSGGIASASPSVAPSAARTECVDVQLPGISALLGRSGSCLTVRIPGAVGGGSLPVSLPVQLGSLPAQCLDVQLPGMSVSVGRSSPPVQCLSVPLSPR